LKLNNLICIRQHTILSLQLKFKIIPEEAKYDWPEIDRRVVIPTHGENLQVSQATEAKFDALERLSSNDALLVVVQIGLN